MQLLDDVYTSDQLSLVVELGVCWPVTVLFESLSQLIVLKDVEVLEL